MKKASIVVGAFLAFIVSSDQVQAGIPYGNDNEAVTIWLVVVNYPEACAGTPCTEMDIFGALPDNPTKATVCYLTGQVVRPNGKAVFAGRLGEGTNHGCFFPGTEHPFGLKDSMRAEVHPVMQLHGQVRSWELRRDEQVAMFQGGCNPDCTDTQFAIHTPGADRNGRSRSPIWNFMDGSPVPRARSTLYRDMGGVRVVFDTDISP